MYTIWFIISTLMVLVYFRLGYRAWIKLVDSESMTKSYVGGSAVERSFAQLPWYWRGIMPLIYRDDHKFPLYRDPQPVNSAAVACVLMVPFIRDIIIGGIIFIFSFYLLGKLAVNLITKPWSELKPKWRRR